MKFTEPEMTLAVQAVARQAFEELPGILRRRSGAATWEELPKMTRYQLLDAASTLVLPGLVALPDRPTVGAAPEFSDEEYATAATEALQKVTDRSEPGAWEALSERKQRKQVDAVARTLRFAVESLPYRQDPDAFVVPDHL